MLCCAATLGALHAHAYDKRLPPVRWENASTNFYGSSYSGGTCPATADFKPDDICGSYDIRVDGTAYGTPEQTLARAMAFLLSYRNAYEQNSCVAPMSWTAGACEIEPYLNYGRGHCRYTGTTVSLERENCYSPPGQAITFNNTVFIRKMCRTPGGRTEGIEFDVASRECVCQNGVFVAESDSCVPVADRMIFKPCNTCYGNPIFPEQGLKVQSIVAGWQPWTGLSLIYNSEKIQYEAGVTPYLRSNPATFGPLWTASFDKALYFSTIGNARLINVSRGGGAWTSFQQGAAGLAPSSGMLNDRLTSAAQGYLYRDADAMRLEEYNDRGQLLKITAIDGRTLAVARTGIGTVTAEAMDEGLPLSLTDHFGRRWRFEYTLVGAEPAARVATIVDPGQGRVTIGYGGNAQVGRLEWADGTTQQMMYERADLPWALTGYLDERGTRAATYGYDALGRAVSTQRALGLDSYAVTWALPPEMKVRERYDPQAGVIWRDHELKPPQGTTVQLPNGQVQALESTASFALPKWTLKTQVAGAGSAAVTSSRSFDVNLNVTRLDDFNGNRSCMSYDTSRNLEMARVEGLSMATDCASVLSTVPVGARKVSTQWHPDWALAIRTAEPGRITTLVYNGQPDPFNGNAVASCAPTSALLPDGKPIVVLCKRVEQATTDETGAQGFDATPQSGALARSTSWTYDATGQVLTETDPRGKVVVTNEYYTDTTADHTKGDLKSSVNSAGHLTQFPRYNAYGKPLEVVDANLVSTTYAYDARQRLTSVSTAGSTTSYEYWPTGLLKKTTQPDGAIVTYEYDDAHRLTAVADGLGNRIEYTLDQSGSRTAEQAKDPQGALKRSMSRVFDALGRAQQTTGRE